MNFRSNLHVRAAALAIAMSGCVVMPPARAADVTEAQAREVAEQLRGWMNALLGGKVPLPPALFAVVPAGDLYRLSIPAPPGALVLQDKDGKPTESLYSLTLRPAGGTRWTIESFQMPSRMALSQDAARGLSGLTGTGGGAMPGPGAGAPGKGAGSAGNTLPQLEVRIREQSARGVYDTALQTESKLEVMTQGISVQSAGLGQPGRKSDGTLDRFNGVFQLNPTPSGGVDAISDWTMEGYNGTSTDPMVGELRIGAKRVHMRGAVDALMTAQLGALMRGVIELGMDAQSPPASSGTDKTTRPGASADDAQRARLRTLVVTLKGLLTGARFEETVEGMTIQAMGMNGGADRFAFSIGGGARSDKFGAFIELGLDGVKTTALPPAYAELLPRSVVLRPVIGNIDVAALTALAEAATDPKADMDQLGEQLKGLLLGHNTTIGLERGQIDLGIAKLTATGSLTAIGPLLATGKAEITMTGYDALMDKVQKLPEAAQAIPVLALVRGLAKTDGSKLVWRIEMAEDQKITVNGIDLQKLGAPR